MSDVKSTYMLKMNVSLAGDVVRNVPDVLLAVAADEVLLRSSVLQRHTRTNKNTLTAFHNSPVQLDAF